MPAPSVAVQVGNAIRTVVFDLDRLDRIEQAVGRSLQEIVQSELAPVENPDPAAVQLELGRRLRVAYVLKFLSGCLDVPAEQLRTTLPLEHVMPLYGALCGGFILALGQLTGGGGAAGDGSHPQVGSGAGAPGPASSSVSCVTSSADSSRPS